MRKLMQGVLLALLAIGVVGCGGGKTKVESDLGLEDVPDWVNEGTNILNDKGGRLFHGVGSAPQMGDTALQQSTADTRARAELARMLSSYLDVVGKDYQSSSSATESSAQFAVSQQINSLSQVNVSGSRIIARWKDKKTKVIYSLAEVDMKTLKQNAQLVQELNVGLRKHLETKGDGIFDGMATKGGK